jgi:probable rRNA maturation factor
MPAIHFFQDDSTYVLKHKLKVKQWIKDTITAEGFKLNELNFIFCSDAYLLTVNQQYLNHDTYTDIITFDNAEQEGYLTGDIFISAERIAENAQKFNVDAATEMHRVIIHGTLHLLGYKDKTTTDKKLMTQKEDFYLTKRTFV